MENKNYSNSGFEQDHAHEDKSTAAAEGPPTANSTAAADPEATTGLTDSEAAADQTGNNNVRNQLFTVHLDSFREDQDPFQKVFAFPKLWWLKIISCGIILIPIRSILLLLLFLFNYLIAKIALLGAGDVTASPLTGWRRHLQLLAHRVLRLQIFTLGIIIKTVGEQDKNVGVIIAAPHTTIVDWLLVGLCGACPVAKEELSRVALLGPVGQLLQTVWVNRRTEESKQRAAEDIRTRAQGLSWPPILIFPEGTNTNGQALIQFRTGAFAPGSAVQPVTLTWPNTVDTVTWTWQQEYGTLPLLLFTMATPFTRAVVEFLPTLTPTPEELEDPRKYADRAQSVISGKLDIPTSTLSVKDAILRGKASSKLPKLENSKPLATSSTSIDFVGNLTFGF